MEQIKSIIQNVIEDIQKKQENKSEDIESIWRKCIKKSAAQHTKIRFFKKGKLCVNVENPGWLYELNNNKEKIIKRLQKLSNNFIKEVQLKVGDIYGNSK